MAQLELRTGGNPGFNAERTQALVHLVGDEVVQRSIITWLKAAGMETRAYCHLGEFLAAFRAAECTGMPCCLLIDAQPTAICGLEAQAILLPLAIRCPIVVVENPLREAAIVSAIAEAIDVDRRKRLIQSRHVEICARHALLTRRERQVMALVVSGLLNKQVGADLGISEITVKAHRGSVMSKMGARSLAELVRMADAIGSAGDEPGVAGSGRSAPARNAAYVDRHSGYNLGRT